MVSEVIISRPEEFEKIKKRIVEGGDENFHVISDFDRTITKGLSNGGKRTETVISQLRSDPKYLGQEYSEEAFRLFDTYHPIEIDTDIPLEEKKQKMYEWWKKHFDLIARSGLTKATIAQVVKERPLKFRRGSLEFVSAISNAGIPLVFMSAAPGDMLVAYLVSNGLLLPSVYVISNLYKFDSKGKAIEIQEPIIHTFNKTEVSLSGTSSYEEVRSRKNVLLLGDSLGDIGMVDGFPYDNLIKVGFLNEKFDEQIDNFKENYDVVITGDGDFGFVNELVAEVAA